MVLQVGDTSMETQLQRFLRAFTGLIFHFLLLILVVDQAPYLHAMITYCRHLRPNYRHNFTRVSFGSPIGA